jgi:micrococcal nuclease
MMLVLKIGMGLVTAGLGLAVAKSTGSAVALAPERLLPLPEQAVISTLRDGSSFEIQANGHTTRIRLANIATPTGAGLGLAGQCLAPEAAAYLASAIPVGSTVNLEYTEDRYGRDLAAVTTQDGVLVNAELVRKGLAAAVPSGDQQPMLPGVEAAAREAAAAKRGLHSPDVPCTVPGQVRAVVDLVAKLPAPPAPGARGSDLTTVANAATTARDAAEQLLWAFQENRVDVAWTVIDPATRASLQQQTVAARDRAAATETALRSAASVAFNREATIFAAQEENARVAKAMAAIRKAEARRAAIAAQAARRAEAARRAVQAARAAQRSNSDEESGGGRRGRGGESEG